MVDPMRSDWFSPIIKESGSVSKCLQNVSFDLKIKLDLIEKLNASIGDIGPSGIDYLTHLAHRIRELENTLRFRENLKNEKRPTWFRHFASTSSGHFSATILPHPIFLNFAPSETQSVRHGLMRCWEENTLKLFPFSLEVETVWSFLLRINEQLVAVNNIGTLKLDNFHETIDASLSSPTLLAFLQNVRAEYIKLKDRLLGCYIALFDICEKFWQREMKENKEIKSEAETLPPHQKSADWQRTAEHLRQEYKDRRATLPRLPHVKAAERQAMEFMGFSALPHPELLRSRYIELARTMHPDITGGSDDKFKVLTKSYRLLTSR